MGDYFIKWGWGWGGVGVLVGCIGVLVYCLIFIYGFFLCLVYMYILYKYVCFICCKLFVNEFVLSLIENIRNSNIFMFNFYNLIKKRCIKNN